MSELWIALGDVEEVTEGSQFILPVGIKLLLRGLININVRLIVVFLIVCP